MTFAAMMTELFRLSVIVTTEIFRRMKEAEEMKEKRELERIIFEEIVASALMRLRQEARDDSQRARMLEDQIDKEIKKR